jgi:hypothetical protein
VNPHRAAARRATLAARTDRIRFLLASVAALEADHARLRSLLARAPEVAARASEVAAGGDGGAAVEAATLDLERLLTGEEAEDDHKGGATWCLTPV